jgi:fatty acid desaturase
LAGATYTEDPADCIRSPRAFRIAGCAAPPSPRYALNLLLASAHVLVGVHVLFLLPMLLLPLSQAWAWTLLPAALLSNAMWSLLHETVHGAFHPNQRVNALAGRALAIAFGSPWRVLRVGHLLHHRYNRTTLDRQEVTGDWRRRDLRYTVGYYCQLLGGLYVAQVLSPIVFFLPAAVLRRAQARYCRHGTFRAHAAAQLIRPRALREIRTDGVIIVAMVAVSAWQYGSSAWMLLATFAARGFLISFLDYVYHYDTPVDDVRHGRNLRLAPPIARMLLHFNLHGVHHRHPNSPWWELPWLFESGEHRYDGSYLYHALRQLRGPIALKDIPAHRVAGG